MTMLLVYFILILDSICTLLQTMCIGSSITLGIVLFIKGMSDEKMLTKKWLKFTTVILIVSVLGATFIPTTKQASIIYVLPKIIANKNVQQIPDNMAELTNNMTELANEYLKSLTNDIKEKRSKEK